MAVIRYDEEAFEAYIYIEGKDNKINISTPSYKGVVPLHEAVKILNLLVKLEELPANIHERLFLEVEELLRLKDKTINAKRR